MPADEGVDCLVAHIDVMLDVRVSADPKTRMETGAEIAQPLCKMWSGNLLDGTSRAVSLCRSGLGRGGEEMDKTLQVW